MIEITTGVVFLMSSLYGSGHSATQVAAIGNIALPPAPKAVTAEAAQVRTFTNSKEMEEYLREQYADNPILVDIARCESTFRHFGKNGSIIRGMVNGDDVGVMQINEYYHGETAKKMGIDLHTVEGNVAYAKYLYGKYGSQPWSASSACWSKASSELAKK